MADEKIYFTFFYTDTKYEYICVYFIAVRLVHSLMFNV